ncbi:TOMM precursor leader peptide-binding protein [Streptomyces sp. NBC_01190]|uniref:TOMM precursor leader peptide-binding protein n=1 Tax=Streptomyces sp. NBC_01190 TaxID=2903767 RepID=UPI003865CCDF|nr:TOMM precursor leader peptide-binding protein [Streptomyces sp. NBC_01190]
MVNGTAMLATTGKLRLKAHLTAVPLRPDTVLVMGEEQNYVVSGAATALVARHLDGRHSAGEILAATADRSTPAEAYLALTRFRELGCLTADHLPGTELREVAFWESYGLTAGEAKSRLARQTVVLIPFGRVEPAVAKAVDVLEASGVRVRVDAAGARPAPDELAVAITDEYLDPRLAELNDHAQASGRPWLLLKAQGREVWVGPFFHPGRTGCWECLRGRLEDNRPVSLFVRSATGGGAVPRLSVAASSASVGLAVQFAANAITAWLLTGACPVEGHLLSVHTGILETERHPLVRQPQCAACGDASLADQPVAITLAPDPVGPDRDNGWRVVSAEVTQRRLDRHVDRLLGVVSAVRSLTPDLGTVTHSYQVAHGFAASRNLGDLRLSLRGRSGGKGRTDVQARVSGVCEAVERYCGVWQGNRRTIEASYHSLGDRRAVGLDQLLLFSQQQYAHRAVSNGSAGRSEFVPEPFDGEAPISWSTAWSLSEERERLIPAAYAWYGHPDLDHHFCVPDSNGSAAGNTREEAILQGYCELVERDSVAMWWYGRLRRPGVDLDSFQDPYIDELRDFYAGRGREIWVLDLSADLGIPTFAALSRRVDGPVEDIVLGFGSHLEASVALVRALTEMNQFLPGTDLVERGGGTLGYREDDRAITHWWRTTAVRDNTWLLPHPGLPATTASAGAGVRGLHLADAVRHCVETARAAGLEVIVLDQSRPDIELSVMKVVVPGLRHFWRRLGPGRLYDLPVRLGWLDTPPTEAECNPVSLFF